MSLPPTCRAAHLVADQQSPGGGAMGTFYTPIAVTNQGPDCLLTTGSLTLWSGRRQLAALDLLDRHDAVALPAGASYRLSATVADASPCAIGADGQALPVTLGGPFRRAPALSVAGPGLSPEYRCRGVELIGAARRAAPSR
jgi:hypothetical protein